MAPNKLKLSKYNKHYARTIKGRYKRLLISARQRSIECNITFESYCEFIKSNNCYYCGGALNESGHGLDRIASNEGYNEDNIVSCCKTCNSMKQDLAMNEFFEKIKSIYNKHCKNHESK